jgi:hypothetical protein
MNKNLSSFRLDQHSQNGEDGIIAEIIKRIGLVINCDFYCVEFGAWDGVHLSNTFALVESHGASAVYIEGDKNKFRQLLETTKRHPSITPVEGLVTGMRTPEGPITTSAFTGTFNPDKVATLDEILRKTACPREYELLSIDIDSHDLEVWEAHNEYQPKIVVIEINSSIPPGILQWHRGLYQGNSFSSTLSVAKAKGYTLAYHTGNMIFVRDDLVGLIGIEEVDRNFPERLFDPSFLPGQAHSKSRITRALQKAARQIIGL